MELEEEKGDEKEPEPTPTPEETPGSPEGKPEGADIDFKKELEDLEKPKARTDLEKAQRALHFTAQRVAELGGDPADILPKPKTEKPDDVETIVERKFAEKEARTLARNDDEFKLIMWHVTNQNLSVENAWLLANKGRFMRSLSEATRANPQYSKETGGGRKVETPDVPTRSPEEQKVLQRRGMAFNPKTKTWQGKYTEEYYDKVQDRWLSQRLQAK